MYNQSYDEYLRSVLGVNNQAEIYNTYNNSYTYPEPSYYRNLGTMMNTENLEEEYPEMYKIIYPMVRKICDRNSNRQITSELLENMTNEIYENVEPNITEVNVNVQVREDGKTATVKTSEKNSEMRETRQRRNPMLHDLIKILILRELGIGVPIIRPRPPFPGNTGRHGMPGMPPMMPNPRPIPYVF